MKKHSKVGNRKGKPAYRTPSTFKNKKQRKSHRSPRFKEKSGRQQIKKITYYNT